MSTYVLLHGSWHGAWCWYRMLPRLERAGHKVIAPDLPGLGRDMTPAGEVSLESWTDYVCGIVEAQAEPVVLVGHSRGGILCSTVAEKVPRRVARLVYVAAGLCRDGEVLRQLLADDGTSALLPHLVLSPDGVTLTVKDDAVRGIFYGQCPEEDVALAKLCLRPEPRKPGGTAVRVSEKNFGSVPRDYVECLRDKAIPIALQRRMHGALPCRRVMSIDTDHSPFFSAPDRLAECLL